MASLNEGSRSIDCSSFSHCTQKWFLAIPSSASRFSATWDPIARKSPRFRVNDWINLFQVEGGGDTKRDWLGAKARPASVRRRLFVGRRCRRVCSDRRSRRYVRQEERNHQRYKTFNHPCSFHGPEIFTPT